MRRMILAGACLLSALSVASAARAQVTLTGLKSAKFKDSTASAKGDGAVIKFVSDPALLALGDPTCNGGDVSEIYITSSIRSIGPLTLPCSAWSRGNSGFRFADKSGSAGGTRKVTYANGKLTIQMKGPGFSVLYGPVSFIEISFRIGDATYCARATDFDKNDAARVSVVGPSTACQVPVATATATASATVTPTPTRTSTPFCGDGIRQINEACDDGNDNETDCCFSNCQLAASGISCMSDGNPCTDDLCDGAGNCQHPGNSAGCNDGSSCTSSDTCSNGACGGSLIKPWINEVNYDGYDLIFVTKDHEEFVEIGGPAGLDIGGYKLLAIEGRGSGSILQPCLSGNLGAGEAYFTATIPNGTVIQDTTGKGTGLLTLCFANTSDAIGDDGKCDVVLAAMQSNDSNLPEGALSNLWDCADGILLLDGGNGFVDAVSYEGHVANQGTYGAYFVGAPDIGRDWGLATDFRRSRLKSTDNLTRETDESKWLDSGNGGDSPGAVNGIQNLSCYQAPGYTNTRYPIVLLHGLYGFDSLFGVVDYWNGITDALRDGGATVFVATVSQLNSPQARGDQAIAQIQQFLTQTGNSKVNLIGHSQGALDARYIAAVRPDLVASVTSVAGPHKGAAIADFLHDNFVGGVFTEDAIALLGNTLGDLLAMLSGSSDPNDAIVAVNALTSESLATFNTLYPAGVPTTACGEGAPLVNGIRYFSWSGSTVHTNPLDPTDDFFGYTSLVYPEANDGLVGRCSSHLGDVIKDNYIQNHIDEVNLLFGLVSPFEVNAKTLFRVHANRLKNLDL